MRLVSVMVVIVVVIMPVVVGMIVAVGVTMPMPMRMAVRVAVSMGVGGVVAFVVVGPALGLERALNQGGGAALAPDHFGQNVVVLDVDGVRRDLGGRVPVADVPGDPHEAQRVLGADLEKLLRRGLDLDEATILELHGVPVGEGRRLVEIEEKIEARIAFERDAAAVAALVVERDGVGDAIRLHGGFADD